MHPITTIASSPKMCSAIVIGSARPNVSTIAKNVNWRTEERRRAGDSAERIGERGSERER